jgi:hypothetical protein
MLPGEFAQCNYLSGLINDLARAIWRWTEKNTGEKNLPNSSLLEKDPPISLSSDIINCVDTV